MNLPALPTPEKKDIPFIVLAGLPILVVTLAILNYFNILPFSQRWPNYWFSNFPHLPYKLVVVQKEPVTPVKGPIVVDTTANPLYQKAKSLGFNILWIDPKDTTGRTILYDARQKSDLNFRGIGIQYAQAEGTDEKIITYISGIFRSFEPIANSQDMYIKLANPKDNSDLPKVRIIFSKDAQVKTNLFIENLSYGLTNPYNFDKDPQTGNLGSLAGYGKDKLDQILKPNDAVVVSITSKTLDNKLVNERDSDSYLVAAILVLRRFEGKTQIEQELNE